MTRKKLTLAVSVGILAVGIMGGCSATQKQETQPTPAPTPQKQFIEVHDGNNRAQYLNINHIVYISPGNNGTSILMDTSNGMNGGFVSAKESYEEVVKAIDNLNK